MYILHLLLQTIKCYRFNIYVMMSILLFYDKKTFILL